MKVFLALSTSMLVLGSLFAQGMDANGQQQATDVSGSFDFDSVQNDGASQYTLRYSYPSQVVVGSNLTITATLVVNSLTGLKLYLRNYRIDVSVFAAGRLVAQGKNVSEAFASPLYTGAHWGPRKLVMPINATGAGTRPGDALNANVSLSFLADVYRDFPVSSFSPESGRGTVGTIVIVEPGGPGISAFSASALVVVIVSAAAMIYFVRKRSINKRTN